jgi:hypothetical protein
LRRIVLEIGCLPAVIEIAGMPTPGIAGRITLNIASPPDLRGRKDGAEKQHEDENGAQ